MDVVTVTVTPTSTIDHEFNSNIDLTTAFTNNFDKLDSILKNSVNNLNKQETTKVNPFAATKIRSVSPKLNEIKPLETLQQQQQLQQQKEQPQSGKRPFSRSDSFLNRNKKYDAFKNAIDFESNYSSIKPTLSNCNDGGFNNQNQQHQQSQSMKLIEQDEQVNSVVERQKNNKEFNFNEFSNQLIIDNSKLNTHNTPYSTSISSYNHNSSHNNNNNQLFSSTTIGQVIHLAV